VGRVGAQPGIGVNGTELHGGRAEGGERLLSTLRPTLRRPPGKPDPRPYRRAATRCPAHVRSAGSPVRRSTRARFGASPAQEEGPSISGGQAASSGHCLPGTTIRPCEPWPRPQGGPGSYASPVVAGVRLARAAPPTALYGPRDVRTGRVWTVPTPGPFIVPTGRLADGFLPGRPGLRPAATARPGSLPRQDRGTAPEGSLKDHQVRCGQPPVAAVLAQRGRRRDLRVPQLWVVV